MCGKKRCRGEAWRRWELFGDSVEEDSRFGITSGGILNSPLLLVMVFERIVLPSEQRKSLRFSLTAESAEESVLCLTLLG
ncbi:hypothetical protein DV515_00013852 [Chloebia gouldiae]|uniref:Uncharacterized protein n=1 Tax=Chloebia gouldiae TaxID=44316 RepID=A0A3L8S142_CHLGU|nr:hypothetical protein DV515_00013852 [Chloebia gouldiae]